MNDQEALNAFTRLFAGRRDAYGTEEGGCSRDIMHKDWWGAHLLGHGPMGVYPMWYEPSDNPHNAWWVRWGCVDLDVKREGKRRYDYETEDEAIAAAVDLRTALKLLGITGWIERTRSGGYHVWVFAERPVTARTMRRALLTACQVAMVPPTEVNPKAEELQGRDQLGNYVRLPYPGALRGNHPQAHSATRVVYMGEGVGTGYAYLPLDMFLREAEANRASVEALIGAADLYREPPKASVSVGDLPELDKALTDNLSGLTWTMYHDGPYEDFVDRSGWLYKLACHCADDGLSPEEALVIVQAADEAHTRKYVDRKDGEAQLERTVERAYR